ncbi:MAG: hypothetical protein CML95_05080 [Rhodobiaceae bacterium]|nr:hypothetical protein [Rhodobiaceae bacterium]
MTGYHGALRHRFGIKNRMQSALKQMDDSHGQSIINPKVSLCVWSKKKRTFSEPKSRICTWRLNYYFTFTNIQIQLTQ